MVIKDPMEERKARVTVRATVSCASIVNRVAHWKPTSAKSFQITGRPPLQTSPQRTDSTTSQYPREALLLH